MAAPATFESFSAELSRLTGIFEKNLTHYKKAGYDEASLRQEFLNPLFSALGWDVENKAGHIPQKREVEVESRTQIGGRAKRADYLFRTDGRDRFVCEAKKPAVDLDAKEAFQAKRYAWNKDLPVALLTDFEEMIIYVVGGKPRADEPEVGEWKSWHFKQYPLVAQEMWNLLSREKVGGGAIDAALDALPKKKSTGKGKAKQQWLIRPDRSRSLDHEFLEFLDESRRDLASDLYKHNDHDTLLEGNLLNESVQCILDRILFLRICEDRDIDTGTTLQNIVETWRRNYGHDEGRKFRQESMRLRDDSTLDLDDARSGGGAGSRIAAPRESLWYAIVRHFRALDRRPAGLTPFFNGNLFKPHGSEKLIVGDEWLADFIGELSNDETPYLFNVIPVEILGSVYERFLGKVVRPHGKGIIVEEKPEVRKAGGVYYTPRYIVDYIVEQTVGRQLAAITVPQDSQRLENRAASVPEGQQKLAGGRASAASENPRSSAKATSTPDGVPEPHATHSSAPAGAHDSGDADPVAASAAGGLAHRLISDQPSGLRSTATLSLPAFEKATSVLRILDPACGSGSFLIRAFERVCEHWQEWLTAQLPKEKTARAAWEKKHRKLCWVDAETGDIHLTVDLKRRILTENIYGVDLDSAAVEVTQLSLYLKMLENENRTTLQRERELFADEIALLPPLQDNIKCGNSLIASDFSMMSEDLVRVNAFDWEIGFREIMKAGGFDAVIGNPPWLYSAAKEAVGYFNERYRLSEYQTDFYTYFIERALSLTKLHGYFSFVVSDSWLKAESFSKLRGHLLTSHRLVCLAMFTFPPFEGATIESSIVALEKGGTPSTIPMDLFTEPALCSKVNDIEPAAAASRGMIDPRQSSISEALVAKLEMGSEPLEKFAEVNRGIHAYRTDGYGKSKFTSGPQTKRDKEAQSYHAKEAIDTTYLPELKGKDVFRFEHVPTGNYLSYGAWLAEPREPKYFRNPKITIRKVLGRKLHGSYLADSVALDQSLYVLISPANDVRQLKFLLGILLSSIGAWYLRTKYAIYDTLYPWYTRKQLVAFPVKSDRARHDKLVMLVEKMLALTPKLRAAKTEAEKATLQNAVSKTDHDIDALVYELYALTPHEIALVEGKEN